ncbi:MAG: hypothetical protein VX867_03270 [Pseudomonadota bacterium]|nr:hypothetical protein [Pseudomonadota bacterium]
MSLLDEFAAERNEMKTGHFIEKLDSESRFYISTLTKADSDDEFQEYLEVAKLLYDVIYPKPFPGVGFLSCCPNLQQAPALSRCI